MEVQKMALLTPQCRNLAVELCRTYSQHFSLYGEGVQLSSSVERTRKKEDS